MEKKAQEQEIHILDIIKPYLSHWVLFVISVLLMVSLALLYIKTATPVYNIQTNVLIKDAKKSLNASSEMGVLQGLSGFSGMSTNSIENEIEIFKSKKVVREVVDQYHLQTTILSNVGFSTKELFADTSPVFIQVISEKKNKKFPKKEFELEIIGNTFILKSKEYNIELKSAFNKLINLPFANILVRKNHNFDPEKAGEVSKVLELHFSKAESKTNEIQKIVSVDLTDKDATVINLSINSPESDKGKIILNGIVDAYNRDAITDKNSESKKTKEFIDERIRIISGELGEVENQKERFKFQNQITDLATEAKIGLESTASAREKQLELNSQLELTNALISFLRKQNNYQVLPNNIGLNGQEANLAIQNYNNLVLERNRLLENATPQNPLVIDLTGQINSLRNAVSESLQKNKTGIQLALNQYTQEQQDISSKIVKMPLQEKLFRSIERQQQIKENLYLLLLQKREETAISLAVVAPKARVIDEAFVMEKPVAPKKMMILGSFLFLGLIIPFIYVYLKELLNNKLVSKNDIKKVSDIPVLGEIPSMPKNKENLIQTNDFSPLAEAFRILITNMNFMLTQKDCKTIMVTSSVKGEGKTFISMNLSLALANSRNKVVIIGSDIRNPQLQRYLPESKGFKGLSDFLHDAEMEVESIIKTNPFNQYCDIIFSGTIPPNPTELLTNGRYEVLLNTLKKHYNYIIVDTAPLLLVTDTFNITKHSDIVLYVTRSAYTEKALLEFADENWKSGKLHNVGFVLNDVSKNNFGYGNKYGYGYHSQK